MRAAATAERAVEVGAHAGAGASSGSSAPVSRCTPARSGVGLRGRPADRAHRGESSCCRALAAACWQRRVDHCARGVSRCLECKFYADLAGTRPPSSGAGRAGLTATAVDGPRWFESMDSLAARPGAAGSTDRRGWTGTASWLCCRAAAEKTKAPSRHRGPYTWSSTRRTSGYHPRVVGHATSTTGPSATRPPTPAPASPPPTSWAPCATAHAHARHRRPGTSDGLSTTGSTTTASPPPSGTWSATACCRLTSSTGPSPPGWAGPQQTAAPTPIPRTTCRSSGWHVSLRPDPARDTSTEE